MNYDPRIFTSVKTLDEAKRVILTDERGLTTEQRWAAETPHVADLICQQVQLGPDSVVIDYGCGVGRIARELIERTDCRVVGVDISPNMRALASSYCKRKFAACGPEMLDLIKSSASLVICVWVLQHVDNLTFEIDRIRQRMEHGGDGVLFVVNEVKNRFVPTPQGWASDGVDVRSALESEFEVLHEGRLDPSVVGREQSERTFWAVYKKKMM